MSPEELKTILDAHKLWYNSKGGKRAKLCHANLRYADLIGANLFGVDLRHADLYDANLYGADLCHANMRHANLCSASLFGANLRHADLYDANLYFADLREITVNWYSRWLVSELLWREADTTSRQMLAAFVGRNTDWCWAHWASFRHREKKWAIAVLKKYVKDGDKAPDMLK